MTGLQRAAIPTVVFQHLEDATALRSVRAVLVRAPHVKLLHLGRTDERLAAHLDGLSISGDYGAGLSQAALDVPGFGQLFVAAVLAIERRDLTQIERLMSLLDVVPDAARAVSTKLTAWWHKHSGQFPSGTRLFPGAPPTTNHRFKVLKEHTQRRRMAAALYMSLLKPGAVLFNCAAPTRRQERLLAQMES
jgi:hypothetical protein